MVSSTHFCASVQNWPRLLRTIFDFIVTFPTLKAGASSNSPFMVYLFKPHILHTKAITAAIYMQHTAHVFLESLFGHVVGTPLNADLKRYLYSFHIQ